MNKVLSKIFLFLCMLGIVSEIKAEVLTFSNELDSLRNKTEHVDKAVKQLSKFKVSAYLQGQFQYGEEEALLKVGESNEHLDRSFNRWGIRRGRMKFSYNDGIGVGAVQIDVNDRGVSFRDLYIGIKDPWIRRSELMAGVFNRPFGYEVSYSTSSLESPERATIIQYFFPDERDLGMMLTLRTKESSPLSFLKVDLGLFAGNSINRETDSRKDFIGRIGAERSISNWGKWGAGISFYNGFVYNPTTIAYKMQGNRFVKIDKGVVGSYMNRQYFGWDAQFVFSTLLGKTTLRGEALCGTQPGIVSSSKSPNSGIRAVNEPTNELYERPFLGAFCYVVHDFGKSPFSVVFKYDMYDPNTKVKEEEIGLDRSYTTKTDLAQSTLGLGAIYRFTKHIRLQAYYEFNFNEISSNVRGYGVDRNDDVFTFRLQYKF